VSNIKISQFINEPWRDVGLDAEKRGFEICKRNQIEKPEANMVMIIGLCDIITKLEQENDAMRADLLLWREAKP
jgi:regulator of RNase E activity RraB